MTYLPLHNCRFVVHFHCYQTPGNFYIWYIVASLPVKLLIRQYNDNIEQSFFFIVRFAVITLGNKRLPRTTCSGQNINFPRMYLWAKKIYTPPTYTNKYIVALSMNKYICRRCIHESILCRGHIHEQIDEWRRLHNEEFYDLHCPSHIIRLIKWGGITWVGHVARVGDRIRTYRVLVGKFEE